MSAATPDGYLFALAEAWPFLSDAALSGQTVSLRRESTLLLDSPTQRLANELENELRNRAAGPSLEVLASLRDSAWFAGAENGHCSLIDLLFRIAHRTVERQGATRGLRRDGDFCQRLEQQRWLSLLLPSDLILAAHHAMILEPPTCDRLSLVTPILSALLEEAPVSETHLHLGAAIPFELVWTGLMGWFRTNEGQNLEKELDQETGPLPFGSGGAFARMLLCAATARLVMARFLRSDPQRTKTTFRTFLSDVLEAIVGSLGKVSGSAAGEHALGEMLRALLSGSPPEYLTFAAMSKLHRRISGPDTSPLPESLDALVNRDPLATWLPYFDGTALPETRFLCHALSYLNSAHDIEFFARWFWQYTRVRNKLFSHFTLQPGTSGLDWFTRHYDRIRALRRPFKKIQFGVALGAVSREVRLGSLEGRSAPERRWTDLRDELRSAAKQALVHVAPPGVPQPEVGVVFHFIKAKEGKRGSERFLHADPRQKAHGVRFGAWGHARSQEVSAIEQALRHHPELVLVLRGIDVAALELSIPTWPLVPLFRRVREASSRAANLLAQRWPWVRAAPTRVTCHAGEDYRRLVEGLRRVHELVESGILQAGDRIGHGLSLGDPPEEWARSARVVRQPKEDRLDDLLWEIDRASQGDCETTASRLAFVRAEAHRLAHEIYRESVHVEDLCGARQLRHNADEVDLLGFPFFRARGEAYGQGEREQRARKLLTNYLSDGEVFVRGQVPVDVEVTEEETRFLRNAQTWLRRQLAAREITIESNPSSNLLIGNFGNLRRHPSFRLQPLAAMAFSDIPSDHVPLALSINSDDPLCFATTLADEYAYLYGALLRDGVGSAAALAWLQARRQDGHRSRFTLAASAVPEVLRYVVKGDIR